MLFRGPVITAFFVGSHHHLTKQLTSRLIVFAFAETAQLYIYKQLDLMTSRKKSEVWDHFSDDGNSPFAICNHCKTKVKRGKEDDRSPWSATPLWNHLKRQHPTRHNEATGQRTLHDQQAKRRRLTDEQRGNIYADGTPVMPLPEFLTRKTKYSKDSQEQKDLTKLLAEWMADGVLPYELIDNSRYPFA